MIRVEGLTKAYGTRRAVDDLTFDVQPGTVTGFLGPNGAGKSTTMRLVMGLDSPTSGTASQYNDRATPSPQTYAAAQDVQTPRPTANLNPSNGLRWLQSRRVGRSA